MLEPWGFWEIRMLFCRGRHAFSSLVCSAPSGLVAALLAGLLCASAAAEPPRKAWVKYYSGPAGFYNNTKDITADSAGNVVIVGESATGTGSAFATVKYGPDGTELWSARYLNLSAGSDRAFSVKLDADGNVLVGGSSDGAGTFSDYAVVKYDGQTGAQIWAARYNGDYGLQIALGPAGNVYMTGQTYSGVDYDIVTVKFDGMTGALLWHVSLNGPVAGPDGANDAGISIDVDSAGNSYVTGWVQVGYNADEESNIYAIGTVSYDTEGNQRWFSIFGDDANPGQGVAVKVGAGGDPVVTGGFTGQYATVRYNAQTGAVVWQNLYAGPSGNGGTPYAMVIGADGNPVVTGGVCAGTPFCNESFGTVKLDAGTGDSLWGAVYTDPAANSAGSSARGIAADSHGNIFVTGFTLYFGGTPGRAVTAAYDAIGNESWIDPLTMAGSYQDTGFAVATDGLNNPIVGAVHATAPGRSYFMTIKYNVCGADYNLDGFVDGIDSDSFNNDFEAGNMGADYNGDGFVDGIDYDRFNNDFEAGC
jgi:hypothetical protein